MFSNYFKIAYRNLIRNRLGSFIHIFGLTLGLTGCFLIGLFVMDELKFDNFHPDGDRIFRVYSERGGSGGGAFWAGTSPAIGPTLKTDYAEVEETLRIFQIRSKQLFQFEEKSFLEEKGFLAESSFFEFFQLPFIQGDPETALDDVNSIVLTKPLAEKYFGRTDVVGEILNINGSERQISAVLGELPRHFHLDFNFLSSFQVVVNSVSEERLNSWVWQDFQNYVKFNPEVDIDEFSEKLPAFAERYAHPETKEMGFHYYLNLQNVRDIYLHSTQLRNDPVRKGSYQYVMGLSIVGIFLLFIACINFINLTTAKSTHRSKEVGVRKTTGANRFQLSVQFLSEAFLIVLISTILAGLVTALLLPELNAFTGKAMVFDWYKNPLILSAILILTLFTGVLAGAYPAFILSSFKPVEAFKSKFTSGGHVQWLRKGLVTLQFGLSIVMIVSVFTVSKQVNFFAEKDMGFEKEQLIHFDMKKSLYRNFESTKNEFLKVPGVVSASTCYGIPGDIVAGDNIVVPGENRRDLSSRIFAVDHEYISTMGMEMVAGRDFSLEKTTDASEAFIVNERAVDFLELGLTPEEAIGADLEWTMWDDEGTIKRGKVIGVVKDFHYTSLHEPIQSSVLHIYPDAYWKLALRVDTDELSATLKGIEETWNGFDTGYPFDYKFVDEGFGNMYESERRLGTLLWIFAILAIVISTIGAFGLAVFATEQRKKEIGIRRVLGASAQSIVGLLTLDFIKLVSVAFFLAAPLAVFVMNNWLEGFAYSIELTWWQVMLAGFLAVSVAFLTVGLQSMKAALVKPVDSLRNE